MSSLLFFGLSGLCLGIALRSLVSVDGLVFSAWSILIATALALVYYRKEKAPAAVFLLYGALFLLCFSGGVFRMEMATWTEFNPAFEEKLEQQVTYEGVVVRESELRSHATHLFVRTKGETLLVIAESHHEAQYGDSVLVTGKLHKPEAFETDQNRTFDYAGYLHARGVSYMIPFAQVEIGEEEGGNVMRAMLYDVKHAFMRKLEAAIPSPHVALGEGLLLGVKQALGEDLEAAFVKTGITHIVVLSGYNIMLVTLFVMYVVSFLLPFRSRLLFGMGAIILFALLVGLSATVLRASVMAVLVLVAKLTGRTYDVLRGLCIAGAGMLLFNPYLLVFDVGFQLSFTATLGLILLSSHLERLFHFIPAIIGLRGFLTATVAAQLFVTPLLLYSMGNFSVVSVAVNMLVLPMVPVAMLASFATGIIGFVSAEAAQVVGLLAYWSLAYILFIAETFAQLPFASFTLPPFSFVFVIGAYALLAYGVYVLEKKSAHRTSSLAGWTIVAEAEYTANLAKTKNSVFFT